MTKVFAMKSFVTSLFSRSAHLSKFEKMVLRAVRSQLDPRLFQIWDRQVQSINKIQRLPDGVEVNFYRMLKGRPNFECDLAFPNQTSELLVAKVKVSRGKAMSEVVACVWCVQGFIFSIEYSGSVADFEEAVGMNSPSEITVTCELKANLFQVVNAI